MPSTRALVAVLCWASVVGCSTAPGSGPDDPPREGPQPGPTYSSDRPLGDGKGEPAPGPERGPTYSSDRPLEPGPALETPKVLIAADRGSFAEGVAITPPLGVHLEMGYTFTYRRDGPDELERHTAPEPLLRLGLIENHLELRAIWSGWAWTELETTGGDEDHDRGATDLVIGGKLKINDQMDWIPTTGIIAQTSVGAGSEGFSTQEVDPIVKLVYGWDLGHGFGFLGNGNLALVSDAEGRFCQWQAAFCPTYTPIPGTTLFGEYFFIVPVTRDSDAAHSVDFGILQIVHDRIQVDARVGFGLNDEADDFFTGAGVSFLFGPPASDD